VNRRYFITGTDTGVGKTVVTAALMIAFQERGDRCIPVKPIQTGTAEGHDDLAWCLSFSTQPLPETDRRLLTMYRLPLPASPHLAAAQAGMKFDFQSLEKSIDVLSNDWNNLLIEGAGGLLAPVDEKRTMLDLIKIFHATPIVVTHSGLGTLNHTALTLRELERQRLTPAAVVITDRLPVENATGALIRDDNIEQIRLMAGPIPVVEFGYMSAIVKNELRDRGRKLAAVLGRDRRPVGPPHYPPA
jgi:dethiobiotin synthetase